MSNNDLEKFRLALRQMALDAAVERAEEEPEQGAPAALPRQVEDRLVRLAYQDRPTVPFSPHTFADLPQHPARQFKGTHWRRLVDWVRGHPFHLALVVPSVSAAVFAIVVLSRKPIPPRSSTYAAYSPRAAELPGQDGKLMLSSSATIDSQVSALRLRRSQTLTLTLRPRNTTSEATAVYAFVRQPNRPPQVWDVKPQKEEKGIFVLSIPLREAPELQAEQDLLFIFGPEGQELNPLFLENPSAGFANSLVTVHLTIIE